MFFFLYCCYIASLLCYSYVCLYYHACLHYVNKKWSDKDTDCTCCVYCILKTLHSWNHKNLSFPWIWHVQLFFFEVWVWRLYPVTTRSPAGGTVRWILKGLRWTTRLSQWKLETICTICMHSWLLFSLDLAWDKVWGALVKISTNKKKVAPPFLHV